MNTNDLINNWISQSDCFVDYLETLKYEELDKLLFTYKDYDIAIAEALKKYGNKLNTDENLEIYENINFQQAHIYEYIKDFLKRKNEAKFYLTLEVLGKYLMHYNTELQSKIFKIYFCYTQNEKNAAEHLKRVFSISSNSVSPISSFSNACVCLLKNPDNDVFDFCFPLIVHHLNKNPHLMTIVASMLTYRVTNINNNNYEPSSLNPRSFRKLYRYFLYDQFKLNEEKLLNEKSLQLFIKLTLSYVHEANSDHFTHLDKENLKFLYEQYQKIFPQYFHSMNLMAVHLNYYKLNDYLISCKASSSSLEFTNTVQLYKQQIQLWVAKAIMDKDIKNTLLFFEQIQLPLDYYQSFLEYFNKQVA